MDVSSSKEKSLVQGMSYISASIDPKLCTNSPVLALSAGHKIDSRSSSDGRVGRPTFAKVELRPTRPSSDTGDGSSDTGKVKMAATSNRIELASWKRRGTKAYHEQSINSEVYATGQCSSTILSSNASSFQYHYPDMVFSLVNAFIQTHKDDMKSFFVNKTVVAAFIIEDITKGSFELVAFGSGTKWESKITSGRMKLPVGSNVGDIIWDYHAEIIARRSFKRYLIRQLQNGGANSIFDDRRKLRADVRIHFYTSRVPCGGAAQCLKDATCNPDDCWGKKTGEIGTVNIGSEVGRAEKGANYFVLKSCTDKINHWICGGVQGAILYPHIGKICIDSITISDYRRLSPVRMERARLALTKHTEAQTQVNFIPQCLNLTPQIECPDNEYLSFNWAKGDERIEKLDTRCNIGSRICKIYLFSQMCTCLDLDSRLSYGEHKGRSNEYIEEKSIVSKHYRSVGVPHATDCNIFIT